MRLIFRQILVLLAIVVLMAAVLLWETHTNQVPFPDSFAAVDNPPPLNLILPIRPLLLMDQQAGFSFSEQQAGQCLVVLTSLREKVSLLARIEAQLWALLTSEQRRYLVDERETHGELLLLPKTLAPMPILDTARAVITPAARSSGPAFIHPSADLPPEPLYYFCWGLIKLERFSDKPLNSAQATAMVPLLLSARDVLIEIRTVIEKDLRPHLTRRQQLFLITYRDRPGSFLPPEDLLERVPQSDQEALDRLLHRLESRRSSLAR